MEKIKELTKQLDELKSQKEDEFQKFLEENCMKGYGNLVFNNEGIFVEWNVPYLSMNSLELINEKFAKIKDVKDKELGHGFVIRIDYL